MQEEWNGLFDIVKVVAVYSLNIFSGFGWATTMWSPIRTTPWRATGKLHIKVLKLPGKTRRFSVIWVCWCLKYCVSQQGPCRCSCHLKVWQTSGRLLPPRTKSSVPSCSVFRLKAWMNEACTAGTLRTATISSHSCARGVWAQFVILKAKAAFCFAGSLF